MCNAVLGGAVGDALGMPFESRKVGDPNILAWDGESFGSSEYHGLGPGQWTDDSQMMQMVADSLIYNRGFNGSDLSERYVDWITSGRARGYGRTTLLAIQNLRDKKMHWTASGVPDSYGNGTAMRSAPFGVYFRNDKQSLIEIVKLDSGITHASVEAEAGALTIALATYHLVNEDTGDMMRRIYEKLPESAVKKSLITVQEYLEKPSSLCTTAEALQHMGTRADVRQTIPTVMYLFLKFPEYMDAMRAAVAGAGDVDTNCAIIGAMIGARDGINGLPKHLVAEVEDRDRLLLLDAQLTTRNSDNYLKE